MGKVLEKQVFLAWELRGVIVEKEEKVEGDKKAKDKGKEGDIVKNERKRTKVGE